MLPWRCNLASACFPPSLRPYTDPSRAKRALFHTSSEPAGGAPTLLSAYPSHSYHWQRLSRVCWAARPCGGAWWPDLSNPAFPRFSRWWPCPGREVEDVVRVILRADCGTYPPNPSLYITILGLVLPISDRSRCNTGHLSCVQPLHSLPAVGALVPYSSACRRRNQ